MSVVNRTSYRGPEKTRLEEEIHFMETRLSEMGFEGDCAYERAMSRFFLEQIENRREQIAALDSGRR